MVRSKLRPPSPRLIPLDMSKAHENELPGVVIGKTYLCLIGEEYFAGKFSRQWYGLNFEGWTPNPVGLQFDAPGTNASDWKQVWEIQHG